VSRICQRIRKEFTAWQARDLSGVRLDYLFLDASHFTARGWPPPRRLEPEVTSQLKGWCLLGRPTHKAAP
jgi:hypothetical protein